MAQVQITIYSGDGASSSANGTITDPAIVAARAVIDHITNHATEATDEVSGA